MADCNGCKNKRLKKELGDKYLLLGNTVYELDAAPVEGQSPPFEHDGRPIRFCVWFMAIQHSHDDDCLEW